jgi:hypothetical protein
MAERHLDALFAPAIDGRLEPAARRRFDGHIAECERCAAAFAEHCAASEALRSLPAARMPVAVRLPMHAPRSAREAWLERFRPRSAWGLSLTGLAAAAAVVLVVTVALNRGSATPASNSQQALAGGAANVSSSAAGSALNPAAMAPGGAFDIGGRFSYAVSAPRPGQPGESLVVATARQTYAAGDQVEVSARLVQVTSSATTPAPPRPGAVSTSGPLSQAVDIAQLPVLAEPSVSLLAPRAAAQPNQAGIAESPSPIAAVPSTAGIFVVTIPANAVRGQVLTIVATVPAGVPSSFDASAVTVTLQITVA